MSGHSKWHSIKHQKTAQDAKRGKIFTKHAKLIAIAARGGGDPDMNPALRTAIENARAVNMPRDNIERAIKKGTGESKDGIQMEEVIYEGYGPGGVALFIETLTDNKNRTVTNTKHTLNKYGGNLGSAGSVSYLFKKRGLILIKKESSEVESDSREKDFSSTVAPFEAIEMAAIEAGADDIQEQDEVIEVYTEPQDLMKVKKILEEREIKVESAELTYLPQTEVQISDEETAQKIIQLIEKLEEDEDISAVYSNFQMC